MDNRERNREIQEVYIEEIYVEEEKPSTGENENTASIAKEYLIQELSKIVREALNIEKVDIDYVINANSISFSLTMEIIEKISNELKVGISTSDFIKQKTFGDLVHLVLENTNVKNVLIYPQKMSDKKNLYNPFSMTDVQMAYFLGRDSKNEISGISTHYYVELETEFDIERLSISLQKLIDRHPMLRAVALSSGKLKILKEVPKYEIKVVDISHLSRENQQQYILNERNRMSHYVFDAEQWPLFEFKAYKLSEKIHYLFVGIDVLIADGLSLKIIANELSDFYNRNDLLLSDIDFSFRDYMLAYDELKKSEKYNEDKEYWFNKVENIPQAPALPLKQEPYAIKKPRFKRQQGFIEKKSWEKLKSLCRKKNIRPTVVLFTAYAQTLAFWSNQVDFTVNVTVANRFPFHEDVANLIGDFTSVLLLEVHLDPKLSFWENASTIQDTLMKGLDHRHFDGIELIREIATRGNLNNKAVMPVVFSSMMYGDALDDWAQLGDVKFNLTQTSQVFLDNQVWKSTNGINIIWDYVEQLFDADIIDGMFDGYIKLLKGVIEDKEEKLDLSHNDRKLIEKYNFTEKDIRPSTLHGLFTEQAAKTPQNVAVMFNEEVITYKALNEKSNQVARYLYDNGIGCNNYVAVLGHRDIGTIVNILGILKAGAAYVPINPDHPKERRNYILENAGCKMLLSSDIYMNEKISKYSVDDFDKNLSPEDTAYVIYTSGSTGRPKGVIITHQAAANTIIDINSKFKVNYEDRIIGLSSLCFDLSVYDIFGCLAVGAPLVQIKDQKDMHLLIDTLKDSNISIWNSVPAIMDMFIENLDSNFNNESLRLVLLSGDWIPLYLPDKIKKYFPNANVISLGGATEASIWSIYYPIKETRKEWKSIPYGIPLANQKFYVLNHEMEICPVDVQGELYIGGIGLAQGYLNDYEKTISSFINHPKLGRLYKTGDYGVMRRQGYIEFLGRKDYQVKIRGYRIELGEIENCLIKHEHIKNTVVLDCIDEKGIKYLCAYIVSNQQVTSSELKEYLVEKLPDYMIPSKFIYLDEIPLTNNGKVDRKALPQPEMNIEIEDDLIEPRNDIEEKLVPIWSKILGFEKIGINSDFFELGGNSLYAQKLVGAIEKNFKVRISIRILYKRPTIEKIAEYIADRLNIDYEVESKPKTVEGNTKFYWSPVVHWKKVKNGIQIGNFIYKDVVMDIFPEFYFISQKGATLENLLSSFEEVNGGDLSNFINDLVRNGILVNSLLNPLEIFSTQDKLFKHEFGEGIAYNSDDYYKFKKKQLNRGFSECKDTEILLETEVKYPVTITNRRTHRIFNEKEKITIESFSQLLSVLKQNRVDDKINYYYATAGGLYPIDIFIYIKEDRVENIKQGLYYYNPVKNSINLVNDTDVITEKAQYFRNKSIFKSSAFSMFLIYNSEVNMPIYGSNGYFYACIDSGIIVATLNQVAEMLGIGVCSIGDMQFETIQHCFNLNDKQIFLHAIEMGLKSEVDVENFGEILPGQVEQKEQKKYIFSNDKADEMNEEDSWREDIYQEKNPDIENINNPFPLTDIQQAYLVGRGDTFELGNVPSHYYVEIETNLNYDRLNKSIKKVIDRHPMLRAIILPDIGMQKILEKVPEYNIEFEDISFLNEEQQKLFILKQREIMSHQSFEVNKWPLFAFKMFKLSEKINYLFMSFDLLICDGASMDVTIRDIMHYYNNDNSPLKEIQFSFRDYVIAYDEFKCSETYKKDKEYWTSKLHDFPMAPVLPFKQSTASVDKPHFKQVKKHIDKRYWQKIKSFARKNHVTLSSLLCTIYAEVLAYWSNQSRLVLDLTVFNRCTFHKDVDDIVGDFTSLILLDVDLAKNEEFVKRVQEVQDVISESLEHKHYDGVQFIRDISKYNNLGLKAVAPIVFTSLLFDYAGENSGDLSRLGEVKWGASQTPQVYLDCQVSELNKGLYITWDYVDDLFDREVIEAMFNQYIGILYDIEDIGTKNEFKLIEKDRWLIEDYNKTEENIEHTTLQKLFIEQVTRTPENIAVISKEGNLTYKELHQKSNQVANYLKERGIGRNCLVGVLGERCSNTIVNLMGILKVGAAYVPIDPEYPMNRREYIRENSGFTLLLEPSLYSDQELIRYSVDFEAEENELEDVAYIIYTSGSTGKPKGVVINHGAVTNTIIDINRKFDINGRDKIIGISSMCFDLSVYDIFGTLSTGASLVIVPDHRDVNCLIETVEKHNITLWNSVPAIMNMALENIDENFINTSLRVILLSGDWIPLRLPDKIKKHFVNAEVISLGGATEASIWSIYHPITEIAESWKSIPYGIPLANQKFYVLNFEKEICPVGVKGELYIGGMGVADKYLNDEEKTKNSFIDHHKLGRLYRTGDYGIMRREGYIEFLGREDHQVKIRGYRIELGEIQTQIMEHKEIRNAVVIDGTDSRGKKYICAYFVSDRDIQVQELREYLALYLPEYMIPTYFMRMDEIPLTTNGKIDRKRLTKPEITEVKSVVYEKPRNEIEEKLVDAWQDIMGMEKIGVRDDFFELGGDSIKAIQISARMRKYGLKITMQELFLYHNIAELSKHVKDIKVKADQGIITGAVKLGPVQKWFFDNIHTDRHHWNQGFMLSRQEDFNEEIIKKVFEKIIEHHDALRMAYSIGENIEQVNKGVHESIFCLRTFDLRDREEYHKEMQKRILETEANMDLANGPLVNLGLFKTPQGDQLLITVHHLVIDGVSWRILLEDFIQGYDQADSGSEISFQDKTTSFKGWIEGIYEYAESKKMLDEVAYWKNVENTQVDRLIEDMKMIENRLADADMISITLSEKETDNLLKNINKAYKLEINEALLSALGMSLKEWSKTDKIAVNIEGHGREEILPNVDVSRTVGWFTSMYPIILDMIKTEDCSYYIKQVKEILRKVPNRGVGYGILRYISSLKNSNNMTFGLNPEISFNYLGHFNQHIGSQELSILPVLDKTCMSANSERRYILDIVGFIYNNKLTVKFVYNKHVYNGESIVRLSESYKKNLINIIDHCMDKKEEEIVLSDLEYDGLTADEFEDIIDFINE